MEDTHRASCDEVANAASVFKPDGTGEYRGHCMVTILCTMKDERARQRYLELTREIAIPRKAACPDCLRVTQTIPQGGDKVQVLWFQEWTSPDAFKGFMRRLFQEHPRLNEINDCLSFNPEVTISRAVQASDLA